MQSITDLWKTTFGKLTIGGRGGLAKLLSICFLCIVFVLVWPNETIKETALPPKETPTEPLPTETPAEPLPTETPAEPLPTETPAEPLPTEAPTELPPTEPPTKTPTPEVKPVVTTVEPPPIQPTPTEPPPQPTVELDSGNAYVASNLAGHRSVEACSDYCLSISESYGDLAVNGGQTNPPAEQHADLNLALRGYEPINTYEGLVDYNGETDPQAPQLPGLFADNRTPTFSAVYQVYGWDWGRKHRGKLITDPEVTLAGLAVAPGETIHVPDSGYTVGSGYEAVVLYASSDRITLKYTPDGHVTLGYTLHVENVCVEPRLLALYQLWNEAGRGHLPALRAGQAFGCAHDSEIGVVIRDTGAFLDPRSRKDWWQGR